MKQEIDKVKAFGDGLPDDASWQQIKKHGMMFTDSFPGDEIIPKYQDMCTKVGDVETAASIWDLEAKDYEPYEVMNKFELKVAIEYIFIGHFFLGLKKFESNKQSLLNFVRHHKDKNSGIYEFADSRIRHIMECVLGHRALPTD